MLDPRVASSERSRRRLVALSVLALVPAALLLLLHAGRYYPFFADDGFISLRYAERLVSGQGLTWSDGPRVEGYSNLSWVLATALLHALGMNLIDASRLCGVLGLTGALWCVVVWERGRGSVGLACGAIAATGASLTGALAIWLIGGLEQPFVALFLCAGLLACRAALEAGTARARGIAGGAFALLCWTRPDGPMLVAVVLASFWMLRGLRLAALREVVRIAWPALAAVLLQLLFRLLYYADWVPNTARAKVALSPERLLAGASYLLKGLWFVWPLAGVAVGSTLLGWPALRRSVALVWTPLFAWAGYVVFIGGDIFPGRRHLVPIVVLLALAAASGLAALSQRRRFGPALCMLSVLVLGYQVALTYRDPENDRAISERWEWDGMVIGKLLQQGFARERPLLAVDPAGCVPFFSRLPALDMLGLNDRYLARHPPTDFGKGILGHELGNGEYVYRQKPDLVLMCAPGGSSVGCFRSGLELMARADFQRDYAPIVFEARDPYRFRSLLYVRRHGRLGASHEANVTHIPGLWLAAHAGVVTLDAAGRLGTELPAYSTVELTLPAACPDCRVQVDSSAAPSVEQINPNTLRIRTSSVAHVRRVTLTH